MRREVGEGSFCGRKGEFKKRVGDSGKCPDAQAGQGLGAHSVVTDKSLMHCSEQLQWDGQQLTCKDLEYNFKVEIAQK